MSARVIVVGASGFIGRALLRGFGDRALGTYASTPFPGGIHFDALTQQLEDTVDLDQFTHAVFLLSQPNPDACADDPEGSRRLNVEAVGEAITEAWRAGVVPVFTSSELVFDGVRGAYAEDDPPNPILVYGRQKVEVERLLAADGRAHLTVRLPKVYGTEPDDGTLFSSFLEQVRDDLPIRAAVDQIFSPMHVDEAVEALMRLIDQDHRGLFHIAGPRPFSRRDALEMVLDAYRSVGGRYGASVTDIGVRDLPTREVRPANVSMRNDKLVAATDVPLRDPEEWCGELVERALGPSGPGSPRSSG